MRAPNLALVLTTAMDLCALLMGSPASGADLRDGETLDGYILETYIEVPFKSRDRAQKWLQMNPDMTSARLSETAAGAAVRIPRETNMLSLVRGHPNLLTGQRVVEGILYNKIGRGVKEKPDLEEWMARKEPFPGAVDARVTGISQQEGWYLVSGEERIDLVAETQSRMKGEGTQLKYLVRHGTGDFRFVKGLLFSPLSFGRRQELKLLGVEVMGDYAHPVRGAGALARVGWLKTEFPLYRHGLLSPLAFLYFAKIETRTFKNGSVVVGDGRYRGRRWQEIVWEFEPKKFVMLRVIGDADPTPLIEGYLDWLPSIWPGPNFNFDWDQFAREEMEISLKNLHDFRNGRRREAFSFLKDFNDAFNRELRMIEVWYDTPYRIEHVKIGGEAGFDRELANLSQWWRQSKDAIKLRKGAPILSIHELRDIETPKVVITPEQRKLNDRFLAALKAGDRGEARKWLEKGADVNARDRKGFTPLILAARAGDLETAKFLITHGPDLNLDSETWTALKFAANSPHRELLKLLLENGAETETERGYPALFYAARRGALESVKLLLEHGADANGRTDDTTEAPLHKAAGEGHTEVVKLLIEKGADVDLTWREGRTPLLEAIIRRHPEAVKALLEAGVEVRKGDLLLAVKSKSAETVKLILGTGKTELGARDDRGNTSLQIAKQWKLPEIAGLLEAAGAKE